MTGTRHRLNEYSDWLALLWSAVIGYLSLSPLPQLPEIAVSDKLEHFAAYTVLGFLGGVSRRSIRGMLWISLAIVAYGGAIELIQPYVNRYMELGDFIANACGTLFGATISFVASRRNVRNR